MGKETESSRIKTLAEADRIGRENSDKMSGFETVDALMPEEQEDGMTEEVFEYADNNDKFDIVKWGNEEDAEYFVLEEESVFVDEDTAYRSRVIRDEGGVAYRLVEEKEEGDIRMSLYQAEESAFTADTREDFNEIWAKLQNGESEVTGDSRLNDKMGYTAETYQD